MAPETSSGRSQRFTLDHSAFEKFLAAAWVLQCLHDQQHSNGVVDAGHVETIIELAKSEQAETGNGGLQPVIETLAECPPTDKAVDQAPEVSNDWSPEDVEPNMVELKQSSHVEDAIEVKPDKQILPVWDESTDDSAAAVRGSSGNLRTAYNGFGELQPTLRVTLTLRAFRAAAIATPVSLLAIVGALLLLETSRREPVQTAQASSTGAVYGDIKRIESKELRQPSPIPLLEVSHKHITDAATLSVVQGLSRYEIRGLRRQAKYGDASASFALGMTYEVGRHVPQNCAEAARWVKRAAEAGNRAAQYNLGLRYRDGDGVRANRAASLKWLHKAAAGRNYQARLALRMLASR
jgi:hypothetical protein